MIDFEVENAIRSIAILILLAVGEMVGLLTIGYFLYYLTADYLVPFFYKA
jgi:hypothetical protein